MEGRPAGPGIEAFPLVWLLIHLNTARHHFIASTIHLNLLLRAHSALHVAVLRFVFLCVFLSYAAKAEAMASKSGTPELFEWWSLGRGRQAAKGYDVLQYLRSWRSQMSL